MNEAVHKLIDDIILREGGLNENPNDRGGITNKGVSLRYAKGIGLDMDGDGDVDGEDIRLVDRETAARLFLEDFYRKPGIDRLPVPIQAFATDCAVNHGPANAIRFVQRVCIEAGFMPAVSINGRPQDDGVLGPKTIEAARRAAHDMGRYLLMALVEERKRFFRAIVRKDPSQTWALNGWLARAEGFLE